MAATFNMSASAGTARQRYTAGLRNQQPRIKSKKKATKPAGWAVFIGGVHFGLLQLLLPVQRWQYVTFPPPCGAFGIHAPSTFACRLLGVTGSGPVGAFEGDPVATFRGILVTSTPGRTKARSKTMSSWTFVTCILNCHDMHM
jgi:hypothetical protein